MYYIIFTDIYLSIEGHLVWFQFAAIMDKATVNIKYRFLYDCES